MRYKNVGIVFVIIVGIYLVFRFLLPLVLPFVVAGLVSILYYPFLRKLYKNTEVWSGRKKRYVLVVSVVLFYGIVFAMIGAIASYLFDQGRHMFDNMPFYEAKLMRTTGTCCRWLDEVLHIQTGTCRTYLLQIIDKFYKDSMSKLLPRVTTMSVQILGRGFGLFFSLIVTMIATFFMIQDYERIRESMISTAWGKCVCQGIVKAKLAMFSYLKAQGLILLFDGTICTIAFLLIRVPYAWVLGPLTALLDALPVLGIGFVLFPGIVYYVIARSYTKALFLVLVYIVCVCIRQITEPKLVGNTIGLRPLYTIVSMYVGFRLFGVFGFVLGPVGVLLGRELYEMICEETSG